MKISFDNPKHEALINDYPALCKRYNGKGIDYALDILDTINALYAANSLSDLPHTYHPHPLQGVYKGCFGANVTKKDRVIFKPDHKDDPEFRIDNPKSIKAIIILEIFKNYH